MLIDISSFSTPTPTRIRFTSEVPSMLYAYKYAVEVSVNILARPVPFLNVLKHIVCFDYWGFTLKSCRWWCWWYTPMLYLRGQVESKVCTDRLLQRQVGRSNLYAQIAFCRSKSRGKYFVCTVFVFQGPATWWNISYSQIVFCREKGLVRRFSLYIFEGTGEWRVFLCT